MIILSIHVIVDILRGIGRLLEFVLKPLEDLFFRLFLKVSLPPTLSLDIMLFDFDAINTGLDAACRKLLDLLRKPLLEMEKLVERFRDMMPKNLPGCDFGLGDNVEEAQRRVLDGVGDQFIVTLSKVLVNEITTSSGASSSST